MYIHVHKYISLSEYTKTTNKILKYNKPFLIGFFMRLAKIIF